MLVCQDPIVTRESLKPVRVQEELIDCNRPVTGAGIRVADNLPVRLEAFVTATEWGS